MGELTEAQIHTRLLKRIMSRILADAGTDKNAVYVLVYPEQNNTLVLDGSWEISKQETEVLLELMKGP